MRTFKQLREKAESSTNKDNIVLSKKKGKVTVLVKKEKSGYTVYIDGDLLDTYSSAAEASKMGMAFAKELK